MITEVIANFTQLGNLHVTTSPAVPATLYVNGLPMDDWGFWVDLLPGQYTLSFGNVDGFITPKSQGITINAGQTTNVVGQYIPSSDTYTPVAHGLLHVETSPAVPTTISIDNGPRDAWGLTYVKLSPGLTTFRFPTFRG